jgi:hypothetical protein
MRGRAEAAGGERRPPAIGDAGRAGDRRVEKGWLVATRILDPQQPRARAQRVVVPREGLRAAAGGSEGQQQATARPPVPDGTRAGGR